MGGINCKEYVTNPTQSSKAIQQQNGKYDKIPKKFFVLFIRL